VSQNGGDGRPRFFDGRGRLAFLAGLLLPALGFLCHCLLSPPSSGFQCESTLDALLWLPPGTRTQRSVLYASGHLPDGSPAFKPQRRVKHEFGLLH
jgi:hypothetical protein